MSKFCPQCGTENPDQGKFCRSCGAPFFSMTGPAPERKEGRQQSGPAYQKPPAAGSAGKRPSAAGTAGKKPLNKKLFIGLAAAAAAVIVIIILAVNMGKTIDLTKYVELRYDGPDGYATASADIDYDALSMDALKALGYSEKDLGTGGMGDLSLDLGSLMNAAGKYSDMMKDAAVIENIYRNTEIELDKTENISNGDRITATVTFTGDSGKLHVKGGSKTFDVADLAVVQDVDPFAGVKVVFSGVEPYGTAVLEGTEKYSDYGVYYSLDKDRDLSIGDKVTVTVSYDADYLLDQGYHITADSKEYTVEKLDDAQGIDLFEGINVLYDGIAPFAEPYLEENSKYVNDGNGGSDVYVSFEITEDKKVDIGETVTVKANYDAEEFARNGIAAQADTRSYTVPQIDSYMRKCSDLDSTLLEGMKKECEDRLEAYFAGIDAGDTFKHSNEKYAGAYILNRKRSVDNWYDTPNIIYLLYKGNARSTNEYSRVKTKMQVFYAFRAENVIQHADGTQSYDEASLSMVDLSNDDIVFNWGSISAYSGGDAAYSDLISKQKDLYTVSVSNRAIKNGLGGNEQADDSADNEGAEEPDEPDAEDAAEEADAGEKNDKAEPTKVPVVVITPAGGADDTAAPTQAPSVTQAPGSGSASSDEEITIQYGLTAPASDFIFPYSSTKTLTYEEIDAALQDPDQNTRYRNGQLAINEILARYGYFFDPDSERIGARDAAAKFGPKDWYKEAVVLCDYDDPYALIGDMNAVEKDNINAISEWQVANDADEYKG